MARDPSALIPGTARMCVVGPIPLHQTQQQHVQHRIKHSPYTRMRYVCFVDKYGFYAACALPFPLHTHRARSRGLVPPFFPALLMLLLRWIHCLLELCCCARGLENPYEYSAELYARDYAMMMMREVKRPYLLDSGIYGV